MKKIMIVVFLTNSLFSMGYDIEKIQSITNCGSWEKGKDVGYFRILKSYTNGQNYLFVDMMRGQVQLYKTIDIKEINHYHAEVNFDEVVCKEKGLNKIEISIKTYSGYVEEADSQVSITVDALTEKYVYSSKYLKYRIAKYKVVNVRKDDTLNLRAKPNNKSKIIAKLAPNTKGIKVFNVKREELPSWEKVEVNGKIGWVYSKYIDFE